MSSRGETLVLNDSKSWGETVDFESRDSILQNSRILFQRIRSDYWSKIVSLAEVSVDIVITNLNIIRKVSVTISEELKG